MKLEFTRQGLIEALVHVLIMAAASSIGGCTMTEIQGDLPGMAVQDVA